MIVLESTTTENVSIEVTTSSDPTGAAVEFALTTDTTEPTVWVAGSWLGGWSASTGKATALSPLLGDDDALAIVGGVDYDLWVRWTVGAETPVRLVDRVRVS